MKKEIIKEIEIPEGVEVKFEEDELIVKGPEGENRRKFEKRIFEIEVKPDKVVLYHKKATKKEKKMINTSAAHIKNMIAGVQKKFEYRLKACFSHFPITIEIKEGKALIKNFLGEKIPREVEIPQGVEVKVNGQNISIYSCNKELAGQTAADFEKATKVPRRDRRVFQDGIFITHKAGREI